MENVLNALAALVTSPTEANYRAATRALVDAGDHGSAHALWLAFNCYPPLVLPDTARSLLVLLG